LMRIVMITMIMLQQSVMPGRRHMMIEMIMI